MDVEVGPNLKIPEGETREEFDAIIEWLQYLFRVNDIDLVDFLAWNEIVNTQRYMKIDCNVLEGYTNGGKSLIVDNLVGICKPAEIHRERDNSGFHLDQLPAASCALFEKPMITPTNVGTWKLLLEGKVVKTDIKHKDKEGIKRIPIWITTASPITNHVDANESIQLNQRIKLFKFKKCIQHRSDSHTLDSELRRRVINRAPGFVRPVHFAFLWLTHFREIISKIKELDIYYVKNIDRLHIPEGVIIEAKLWQTLLLGSWTTKNGDERNNEPKDVPRPGTSRK
jgi:hypothetical protein